jgi:PPK2 family polyphosphate:nucleotide phosphotransferase
MASQHLVPPRDKKFHIEEYDPGYTGNLKEDEARKRILDLRVRLNELQDLLYADGRFGLLVVLQGMDASGKDGTANSVFQVAGPVGSSVVSFGVPSEEERAHDYLWRIHKAMPERGRVVIFNRSHYESLLVERVRGFTPEERWKERYEEVNQFEQMLSREGTVILKFFLHISKDEQREQLQERVDDPAKRWKFRLGDLDDRKLWGDYMKAHEDVVDRCNTGYAPWHVVPADHKWYRDVVVAEAIIERLETLELRYPDPEEGIVGLKVR